MLLFAAAVGATGCDKPAGGGSPGATTPRYERPAEQGSILGNTVTPVRVGELGPSFAACNAQGAPRDPIAGEPIAVFAAPFGEARRTGTLPPDARFFICSRSIDQRWFGIVYVLAGRAGPECGVSARGAQRQDYGGSCESGWVASAQVRLVSGVDPATDQPSTNGVDLN